MSWVKVKGSSTLVNLDKAREIRIGEYYNSDPDIDDEEHSHQICAVFQVLNADTELTLFTGTEDQCIHQLEALEKNL